MANLKEVKGRIQSVTSTQQITKAMKMVAAAKLRRAQDRILQMRPYALKLSGIMQNISSSVDEEVIENPFAEVRDIKNVLLVVVSSDRGLCGAFNSNVFKYTKALIEEKYSAVEASGGLYILPVGKRSRDYFVKRDYQVIEEYAELFGHLDFSSSIVASKMIQQRFMEGEFDHVEIIFNEFKNVATQILKNEQYLPIAEKFNEGEVVEDNDYIYEPGQEFIFQEIVPKSLNIQFYKSLLESNAAENGARMTAMDKATDNAGELLKELKLTYNRTRQAAITKEILEIVGGAEALAQGS
ncbi:MAG: ATP synthase F1 subunit gamma [Cyclobacteriaceae bacterium]